MPVTDGRRADDIVPVKETMAGEIAVVEAVEALVGSRPEAVPAVDEDAPDKVEAVCELLQGDAVEAPDGMGIGDEDVSLAVPPDGKAQVGRIEMICQSEGKAVSVSAVDAVVRKGQKAASGADQREDAAPSG